LYTAREGSSTLLIGKKEKGKGALVPFFIERPKERKGLQK